MKTFSTFLFSFLVFRYKNEMLRSYRHENGNDEYFFVSEHGRTEPGGQQARKKNQRTPDPMPCHLCTLSRDEVM